MLFWAFINKTLHFGPFGYYYCSCSLDLGLGRFGPHFFKESAPLALGPTFGPWVEFWIQLPYPRKFSSRSNQSRCNTWRDTKNHPSQISSPPPSLFTLMFPPNFGQKKKVLAHRENSWALPLFPPLLSFPPSFPPNQHTLNLLNLFRSSLGLNLDFVSSQWTFVE